MKPPRPFYSKNTPPRVEPPDYYDDASCTLSPFWVYAILLMLIFAVSAYQFIPS